MQEMVDIQVTPVSTDAIFPHIKTAYDYVSTLVVAKTGDKGTNQGGFAKGMTGGNKTRITASSLQAQLDKMEAEKQSDFIAAITINPLSGDNQSLGSDSGGRIPNAPDRSTYGKQNRGKS